ncbi:cytochrome d ubiquinol oxidase subunit II [Microbacterium paludicola]|uniref:Cytochrome d ubiquinol oxidase subunit II n=1 Tax=Microbacterium paludicola TaxID=300019 RepID=A0A4Y9FVK4_9MICO|nr:cytochrome d ubiquinol oxidase subunit II [Microbacterium paludicola]MBF0816694.1 cytochrome d ubiquinol oxidase subunit II [Microbacterium paludicola]TFU32574.1 cytochrome d ubiquinol oxidase subunit II [Microbacterium paludicola]
MEPLAIVWFIAIGLLWVGFLVLEGFDLGVGMHMIFRAKDDKDRRVMLNTIGPVWDGNEVWLITAGAAMFAAFPMWYASLFSALYVPLTITLLGLILRAVSIEYRGKVADPRWARFWTWALGIGSAVVAFCIGAALAITSTGLPLDEHGDRVGHPFVWLTLPAVIGGLALVGFALTHGATFLALKSDGPVRERAGDFAATWGPLGLLPAAVWALWVQFQHGGNILSWALVVLAVAAAAFGWWNARARREGFAFTGYAAFMVFGAGSIFAGMFPYVLPSTLDPAHGLTVANASNSPYTLGVMTVVAAIGLPIVIAYQAWSYWVFRKRVGPGAIPEAHSFVPAILRAK